MQESKQKVMKVVFLVKKKKKEEKNLSVFSLLMHLKQYVFLQQKGQTSKNLPVDIQTIFFLFHSGE